MMGTSVWVERATSPLTAGYQPAAPPTGGGGQVARRHGLVARSTQTQNNTLASY